MNAKIGSYVKIVKTDTLSRYLELSKEEIPDYAKIEFIHLANRISVANKKYKKCPGSFVLSSDEYELLPNIFEIWAKT